jgi:hypothetical protein
MGPTIFRLLGRRKAIELRNNVVAGHAEHEVWLVDSAGHGVAGNHLGTPNGADFGSKTGLRIDDSENLNIGPDGIAAGNVIGLNSVAGIYLRGAANDVRIRDNRIGTDPGGNIAWPNRVGILAQPADVEVEIFGNTEGGTQGRVPLARRTVPVSLFPQPVEPRQPRKTRKGVERSRQPVTGESGNHNPVEGIWCGSRPLRR